MEIRHFKLIVAVSRLGSLTKASDELCLSQPALSHQLKEIEEELQLRIFERENNRMTLTPQGAVVKKHAEESLKVLASLQKELQESEIATPKLNVCVQHYTSYNWIGPALRELLSILPNIEIELKTRPTSNPVDLLREDKLDLNISFKKHMYEGLKNEYLFTDELVVVVSRDHRLASKKFIELADFENETVILNTTEKGKEPLVDMYLDSESLNCKRLMHISQTDTIIHLVQSGYGLSILPKWLVCSQAMNQLQCVSITSHKIFVDWFAEFKEASTKTLSFLQVLHNIFGNRIELKKAI